MNEAFTVPMNGLAQGRTSFRWHAGEEFFARFENSEILGADILVDADVEKSAVGIDVDCEITGDVTVICDRCLEDLRLLVESRFKLGVKFGPESADEGEVMEGDREIVFLPDSETNLDLSQAVYDYVCLSLPVQRMHEDGGCNPDVLKYLSSDDGEEAPDNDSSTPFAALKDLIDKNI